MAKMKADVNTPSSDYNKMAAKWKLIDDLLGGTVAMRAAGETWLPREEKEDMSRWQARRDRSILYEAYKDTLDGVVSRPFSRDITIEGDLPEKLSGIADNADGEGTNLTQLWRQVLRSGVNRGVTHVLTDYPRTLKEDGSYMNLAEEQANGIQPRFIPIKADQLIRWRYEKDSTGKKIITEIAWRDSQTLPDGDFGEKVIEYVYVYKTNTWEIYEKPQSTKEWPTAPTTSGVHSFPRGIPIRTLYIHKDGFMIGSPEFDKLAWLNLEHWQSASDQRNILHYARAGILFINGITEDEKEQEVIVGANAIFKSENPEADMKFVEHTGGAIEKGEQDIKHIEDRMEVMGLQPLLSRSGSRTATERSIDKGESDCDLQAWVRALELLAELCYQDAADWTGDELPEDFAVDIYNDFGLSLRSTDDIKALQLDAGANRITQKRYLTEARRRGLYSEGMDIDDEVEATESEPDLGSIGQDPEPEDD